jgi:hypothetical protein
MLVEARDNDSVASDHQSTRSLLLVGLGLAILLVIAVLLRYPGTRATATRYFGLGLAGLCLLFGLAAWVARRGTRTAQVAAAVALRQGALTGLVGGVLWVFEIGFNNFLPSTVSTDQARFVVDNSVWAIVALLMAGVATVNAFRARQMLAGIRAAFWSGLVSGLAACLMGLLLVVVWMNFLRRDPSMIQEYADRGPASGAPDFATYLAYETLTGALLHLLLTGIIQGALLGVVGGALGRLGALVWPSRLPKPAQL